MTKTCTKCGQEKALEEFARQSGRRDGRTSWCRECTARRYQENREERREKSRQYYAAHREERQEYNRRRFAANRERDNERRRQHYAAHREAAAEYTRQRAQRLRQAVLDHYGHACACCSSTEQLVIDHVNGDGKAHRLDISGRENCTTPELCRWLIQNGFPDGFQVLCHPCNSSKRSGSACRIKHGEMKQAVTAAGSVISFRRR